MTASEEWLDSLIEEHLRDLFPSFNFTSRSVASHEASLTAIAGFTSDAMTGALGLVATSEAVMKAAPFDDAPIDPGDWIGELANQALGRLKLALLGYGITLAVATPVVLKCQSFEVRCARDVRAFMLRRDDDVMQLWIEYRHTVELPLPKMDAAAPAAGDMMLFF